MSAVFITLGDRMNNPNNPNKDQLLNKPTISLNDVFARLDNTLYKYCENKDKH